MLLATYFVVALHHFHPFLVMKIKILLVLVIGSSCIAYGKKTDRKKKNLKTDTTLCAPGTRAMPAPLSSGPFPSADWVGTYKVGAPNDPADWALQKALGIANNKSRIKIYGWIDPSYNFSTSSQSNIPVSYAIQPNSFQLGQAVVRFERQPNTVQTNHVDWGFRLSNVYGLDYRYTVARGWLSDGYFKKNNLYGYDPVEAYAMVYVPKVAQGMLLRIGRYISPADIEAQLSPDNYLYTHSVMFSYDPYTQTGVQATVMLNPQWSIELALNGGNDLAIWDKSAGLCGQGYVRYVSTNNNNSLWMGVNQIGKGTYSYGHDNLNHVSGVWGHRFNPILHMMTEFYYEWEKDAALGGSASYGPVRYGAGGGPGPIIPGTSTAVGLVNYFQILLSKKNYFSIRNDYLNDQQGWRTGYATQYTSHTIGFIHQFTNYLMFRPEIRFDKNWNQGVTPYNLGTKSNQFTANMDMILRF